MAYGVITGRLRPNNTASVTAAYVAVPPPALSLPPATQTVCYVCLHSDGSDVTPRSQTFINNGFHRDIGPITAPGAGTYTVRAYTAQVGGSVLYESAPVVVPSDGTTEAGSLSGVPSSGTAGNTLSGPITFTATNVSTPYVALVTTAAVLGQSASGKIVGSAVALSGTSGTVPAPTPTAAGTVRLALLNGVAGTILALSGNITVAAAATVTGITLTPASSIIANSPVETPIGTLSAQTTGGALVNPAWSLTNTATGKFKSVDTQARFAAADVAQASYTIRARVTSDNAAAFEQDLTVTVAAEAPPATQGNGNITFIGMPSSIVAGQPLSAVTFTSSQAPQLVLYNVTTGAEEGPRLPSNTLPANNLSLFTPQTNALYTVRAYNFDFSTLLFESTQISVSAPPGALPAQVTNLGDTGQTQTGVTMNWTATASTYRLLTRPGIGSPYGSLVDTITSATSYTFTGLAAGSTARSLVVPQNSNGTGMTSGQFISSTSS